MFRRRSEISAISAYIDTLLTHPGWKKFKEHWDRQSIDRFLDEREREIEYNPFLRKGRRFDYREETFAFLHEVLQAFVNEYEKGRYRFNLRYKHAAQELANILGVPVPPHTLKQYEPYQMLPPSNGSQAGGWEDDRPSPPPLPSPPPYQAPNFFTQLAPPAPKPDSPGMSDEKRMAALQALMTHPSTPEHERRAALEAYLRLLNKGTK